MSVRVVSYPKPTTIQIALPAYGLLPLFLNQRVVARPVHATTVNYVVYYIIVPIAVLTALIRRSEGLCALFG